METLCHFGSVVCLHEESRSSLQQILEIRRAPAIHLIRVPDGQAARNFVFCFSASSIDGAVLDSGNSEPVTTT